MNETGATAYENDRDDIIAGRLGVGGRRIGPYLFRRLRRERLDAAWCGFELGHAEDDAFLG
jgi:hypothetical protein